MNSDERGDVREFTQVRWPADKHTTFSIALQVYTNNINKNAGKKGSSTEKRDAHFLYCLVLAAWDRTNMRGTLISAAATILRKSLFCTCTLFSVSWSCILNSTASSCTPKVPFWLYDKWEKGEVLWSDAWSWSLIKAVTGKQSVT